MSNPVDSQVIIGKNEYLFLKNDNNHVIDQVTGKLLLSERQIIQWRNIILQRNLLFKYLNIDYMFLVPPNKEVVLKKYLPEEVKFSKIRPITQILGALDYFCQKIFFYKDNFPDSHDLYPKGETHWCDRFAYEYFCLSMKDRVCLLKSDELEAYNTIPAWFDLGSKIQKNYSEKITKLKAINPKSRLVFTNNQNNMGRVDVYENNNKSLPTALIFRDSFFTNLLELVAESFSKVTYIWHPWIDWELVQKNKPNFVINSTIERFLVTLPNDIAGPSWETIVNNKKPIK